MSMIRVLYSTCMILILRSYSTRFWSSHSILHQSTSLWPLSIYETFILSEPNRNQSASAFCFSQLWTVLSGLQEMITRGNKLFLVTDHDVESFIFTPTKRRNGRGAAAFEHRPRRSWLVAGPKSHFRTSYWN